MHYNQENGQLQFGIKAVGKFTKQLEDIKENQIVYIDGPYGVFTKEGQNNDPKVIIAGGIGITPFVDLIKRFGNKNTKLFYSNKYLEDAINREEFKQQLTENYIEIVSEDNTVEKPIILGKINENILSDYININLIKSARFFVCGSSAFMATVFNSLLKLEVEKNRIFSEEFFL